MKTATDEQLAKLQEQAAAEARRAVPTTADVEHDGDRGGGAFAEVSQEVRLLVAQRRKLLQVTEALDVEHLAMVVLVAQRLPGLRDRVETANLKGWVDTDEEANRAPQPTPTEHVDADLLRALRSLNPSSPLVARRTREQVMADARKRGAR